MRHSKHKYKLGVNPSHRKSLMSNLAVSLITHGSIKTTTTKAKALKPYIERLITKSKVDSVHNRRNVLSKINKKDVVTKLFTEIGPRFTNRNGGYTRITKLATFRVGDVSEMSYISLVD